MVRLLGLAEKVNVLQSRIFTDRPTPDNAQLSILFKSGAMGNVFASYSIGDGQDHQNSLTMNFENGTVYRNIMEPMQAKLGARPSKLTLIAKDPSGKIIRKAAEFKEMSGRYQWEIFYRAHRGEPFPDEVTPEEVVEGIKILNAMARAAKSGKSEQV
jgi:predicted dehydrogenase